MPLDKLNTQNFAEATLTKAVTAQADTFMVEQTNNLPDVPFRIQLNREIAEVRRKSPPPNLCIFVVDLKEQQREHTRQAVN